MTTANGNDLRVGDILHIPASADLGGRRSGYTIRVTSVDHGPCRLGRRFVYGLTLRKDGRERAGQSAPRCCYVVAGEAVLISRPQP